MQKNLFYILLFALIGLSVQLELNVSIYYDIADYNCKRELVENFKHGYDLLKSGIDFGIEFVPFSENDDNAVFANKVQACALNQENNEDNKVGFVACAAMQDDPSDMFFINICVKYWGYNLDKVNSCINGSLGEKLLGEMSDKTSEYVPSKVSSVPIFIYNDEFSKENNDLALNDFYYGTCHIIDTDIPECPDDEL